MADAKLDQVVRIAPVPGPEELGDEGFQDAWRAWAGEVVARWNGRHPRNPPFVLKTDFDGCTFAPDVCAHCCVIHDLDYHHRVDRRAADLALRRCIARIGAQEDRFGWWWVGVAWVFWAAVRAFGGRRWRT